MEGKSYFRAVDDLTFRAWGERLIFIAMFGRLGFVKYFRSWFRSEIFHS